MIATLGIPKNLENISAYLRLQVKQFSKDVQALRAVSDGTLKRNSRFSNNYEGDVFNGRWMKRNAVGHELDQFQKKDPN